jgi:excisionase family DNA binding protein
MATLSEPGNHYPTTLGSIPVRLQHLLHQAAILLGVGDRTIWRIIREGRLEAVRHGCRVSVSRAALEKLIAEHADASCTRVLLAPPHSVARVMAAARSVQS